LKKKIGKIYLKIAFILNFLGFGKVVALRKTSSTILSNLRPDYIESEGHKFFLDESDSLHLFPDGIYEEFGTSIVKQMIKKGDVVLDLGAHIGYFTLIFAKLVGENGKVYAFEPSPDNYSLLKKNVQVNGYNNVILVKNGVSNKTGKNMLYLSDSNPGDNMIIDTKENRQSIEIETVRLDDYFRDFKNQINFIKMDIQGAELDALRGMSSLLKKMENIKIMSEFAPKWLKKFGNEPIEYLKLLKEFNFKIFEIDGKKKKISRVNSQELIKKYSPEREEYTNLLCTRDDYNEYFD